MSRELKLTLELIGHTNIQTTSDIYVYVDPSTSEEATEALATPIAPGRQVNEQLTFMVGHQSDKIQV